jgi:hypothetical protein
VYRNRGVTLGKTCVALAHHLAQRVDIGYRLKCARIHEAILAV